MTRATAIAFAFGVILLSAGSLTAAAYPELSDEITPAKGTVGTPFKLTVSITAPELGRVSIKEPFVTDKDKEKETTWTLLDKREWPDEKLSENEWRRKIDYTITTFETGVIEVPHIDVSYQSASASPEVKPVPAKTVEIESLLPKDGKLPAANDIKGPVVIAVPRWIYIVPALVILAIVGFLARGIWSRLHNRIKQIVSPPKSLDEWALDQIDALEREKLIEAKKINELYTRMADTLRVYLGRLFEFKALDLTSFELLNHLERETEMSEPARERAREVLEEADLVKFAKYLPEAPFCRHALDHARDVVKQTKQLLQQPDEEESKTEAAPPASTGGKS